MSWSTYVITNWTESGRCISSRIAYIASVVRVVRDADGLMRAPGKMTWRVRAFLGAEMAVDVEFVEDIRLEASRDSTGLHQHQAGWCHGGPHRLSRADIIRSAGVNTYQSRGARRRATRPAPAGRLA